MKSKAPLNCEALFFDEFSNTLYIITTDKAVHSFRITFPITGDITSELIETFDMSGDVMEEDVIMSFQYIQELESLIVVTKSG